MLNSKNNLFFRLGSIFCVKKVDFWQLTFIPEAVQNIDKVILNSSQYFKSPFPRIKISSTKSRCVTNFKEETLRPWKEPFSAAFLINLLRQSTTRRNNNGYRGKPCLNSMWIRKKLVGDTLIITSILTVVIHAMIH